MHKSEKSGEVFIAPFIPKGYLYVTTHTDDLNRLQPLDTKGTSFQANCKPTVIINTKDINNIIALFICFGGPPFRLFIDIYGFNNRGAHLIAEHAKIDVWNVTFNVSSYDYVSIIVKDFEKDTDSREESGYCKAYLNLKKSAA